MKKQFYLLMGVVSLFLAAGCQQKVDVEKEKAEISKMYDLQMQAILKGDVEAILSLIPEGHESIGIGQGQISKRTKDDVKQVFAQQFKHGRYIEISDLAAPTIKISPDGKMAWAVGQFKYKYSFKDSSGVAHEFGAVNAWLSVFEKHNSKWAVSAEAETFEMGK